jgi:polar amino acid transport system substrate-binding protein
VQFDGAAAAFKEFDGGKFDAYAGLRPGLVDETGKRPGSRILEGQFAAVQQAVGTAKTNILASNFLHDFVEEAKSSGLVQKFIEQHGVVGRLSVAPPA